ncbi:cbb3-type cytochrome c oxidase subunit I [Vibrio metschnikovii]
MYIIVAGVMMFRGFADAVSDAARIGRQRASAADTFHQNIMTRFFTRSRRDHDFLCWAMPFIVGLMNIIVPLQIGARDVAFPSLNSLSFWLFVAGAILVNIFIVCR